MVSTLAGKNPKKKKETKEIDPKHVENFILDSFGNLAQSRKNIIVKKLWDNYYRVNIYGVDNLSDYFLPKKLIIKSMFIQIKETKDGLVIEDQTKEFNNVQKK
jgi:hypothetical protein